MVHFDDLSVVVRAEHIGGAAGEGEEQIYPDGKISGPHARHVGSECQQLFFLLGRVAGGAEDDGLVIGDGELEHGAGCLM